MSAVKLNQIFHTINNFNKKKVPNSDYKGRTKKPHLCYFLHCFYRMRFWLLTPFAFVRLSRIPIERKATLVSWYFMSHVLFSSLQFKFVQCYTQVMKKKSKTLKHIAIYILRSIVCSNLEILLNRMIKLLYKNTVLVNISFM